jgi:FkbM family methyltransferase
MSKYYGQNLQDKFIEENIFKGYKNGFFIDIGAHDGISINNTLYFEENNNWTGINVEPIPNIYEKLVKNRPKCINKNYAISDNDGTEQFIYNTGYTEMLSGLKKDYDMRHMNRLISENNRFNSKTQIIDVKTQKFSTMCEEHNVKHINLLSIDVEGAEFSVIKSIDFDKVFIDFIIFENNYEDNSVPIIQYLINKNFKMVKNSYDIYMIHNESQFNK